MRLGGTPPDSEQVPSIPTPDVEAAKNLPSRSKSQLRALASVRSFLDRRQGPKSNVATEHEKGKEYSPADEEQDDTSYQSSKEEVVEVGAGPAKM
jgi:hypothetical protein